MKLFLNRKKKRELEEIYNKRLQEREELKKEAEKLINEYNTLSEYLSKSEENNNKAKEIKEELLFLEMRFYSVKQTLQKVNKSIEELENKLW